MRTSLKLLSFLLLFCWGCSSGENELKPKPEIVIPSDQKEPVIETKGGSSSMTFSTTSDWTASMADTRGVSWCTISPTSGGPGTTTLTITADENTTFDERNTTVTLRTATSSRTFTITQKQKDALTVTSSKIEVTTEGGEISVEVKANITFDYVISEADKSWITAASTTRGITTSALKFRVAKSDKPDKREGYITIRSGEFSEKVTVYQDGNAPAIILTKNEYTVGSDGETIKVELKSNVGYEVQLPGVNWITTANARAFSSHTHYFTVAKNETYDSREAEILFTNKENGITEKVKVTQAQLNGIVIAQEVYSIDEVGGTVEMDIASNVDFDISIDADWIKENPRTRGLTNQKRSFTVAEMSQGESRVGKILFAGKTSNITQAVTIQQRKHISFEKPSVEVVETVPVQLVYASFSPDENLTWESSDNHVATVTQKGAVTGVNKGKATITVATKDGKYKASCEVSVKSITDYISFSITSSGISVGGWVNKTVSSTIQNSSQYSVNLISLTAKHPKTNAIIAATTDPELLGTLKAGGDRMLGVENIREDIIPIFLWEYSFGGNRYVNSEKVGSAEADNQKALLAPSKASKQQTEFGRFVTIPQK